jgi:hypothetical protein
MPSDLVEVRGLLLRRGSFTLDVPSWTVAAGDVVGVVGLLLWFRDDLATPVIT